MTDYRRLAPARNKSPRSRGARLAAALLPLLAGLLFVTSASATLTHFPLSCGGCFGGVSGAASLTLDQSSQLVYVLTSDNKVLKFDTSGSPQSFSALSSPELSLQRPANPSRTLYTSTGISVDASGNLYVTIAEVETSGGKSTSHSVVQKYLPSGEPDPTTPEIGATTLAAANRFVTARGIAVDSSGDIFVGASISAGGAFEKSEVDVFKPGGELLRSFGAAVLPAEIQSLALDSTGDVYVASPHGIAPLGGVFAFESAGSCLNGCEPFGSPGARAVAVEPGTDRIYQAQTEQGQNQVVEFDSLAHGHLELGAFGLETLIQPDQGGGLNSIAVDGASHDVFVGQFGSGVPVRVYGPTVLIPTLQAGSVSAVEPTSATVSGTVNTAGTEPADALTSCHFDYVTQVAFEKTGFADLSSGGEAPCEPAFGSIPDDGADHAVSAPLSGLSPATAYRFRLVATNEADQVEGEAVQKEKLGELFTTAGPPLIDTQSADQIGQNSATLHAGVNPFELDTHAHFEYISDADYQANGGSFAGPHPATSTSAQDLGSAFGDVAVEPVLSGLQPGTTYHYRALASNSAAAVTGPDQTFTTVAPALFALQPPTELTGSSATLQVYLDPLGRETHYRFEYGTTTAYGSSTPEASAGEGSALALETAPVSGLIPGTEYHFRAVATNPLGTAASPDFAFTTPAASCPNQGLREEDSSTALPDCRAYEQVSPEQKGGSPARIGFALPAAGAANRIFYAAEGTFAGAGMTTAIEAKPYLAQRGASGWSSETLIPPATLGLFGLEPVQDYSPGLTEFLTPPLASGAHSIATANSSPTGTLYERRPDGSFAPASPVLATVGGKPLVRHFLFRDASADLSHLVVETYQASLMPGEQAGEHNADLHIYEIVGADSPTPALRALNRADGLEGTEIPACARGEKEGLQTQLSLGGALGVHRGELSRDGSHAFFTEASPSLPGGCSVLHLLARVEGEHTYDLAEPEQNLACTTAACRNAPPSNASFQGASADGTRALFISATQLTDAASEAEAGTGHCVDAQHEGAAGCNLYQYDFSAPPGHELSSLSALQSFGVAPRVRSVVTSAADGSRVYFVARGLLTSQPNALGETAQVGAENLYLAEPRTGRLSFVAERCTGPEESGVRTDATECPGLGSDIGTFDLTPDGRFLVFSTYAQLTPDDQNEASDIYRYDAATGSLLRVSIGHDGEDQNGNGGGQDASVQLPEPSLLEQQPGEVHGHIVSDDGSTIAFATNRPLQGSAEAGPSVYEWRQGQVTLIAPDEFLTSGGQRGQAAEVAVSPTGADVVFLTNRGLLSWDGDGIGDIYDARVGGGFPAPAAPPSPCEGTATCHGTVPAPPSVPAIQELVGPPNPLYCHKGFVKRKGKCVKSHRRRHKHRGRSHRKAHRTATTVRGAER